MSLQWSGPDYPFPEANPIHGTESRINCLVQYVDVLADQKVAVCNASSGDYAIIGRIRLPARL